MIYAYCVDKKIENGNIVEYKLKDFEGNTQILKAGILKSLIDDGTLCVVNLTLTSDKKLRTHTIPTLNNLLKPYKGEETQVNINQILNNHRALLSDVEAKNCYLYQHKLFYKKGCLHVLNTSTQEIIKISQEDRVIPVEKVIYIPNGQCLNMIVESHEFAADYMYYSICQIIYDIYTDNYSVSRICGNYGKPIGRKEYIDKYYELGVNDIITLKDKSNNLLNYFILHNKTNSYLIEAPSKEAMVEFVNKIKNFEKYGLKFNVNVFLDGVELELDNYVIRIDKKVRKGTLIRMR